MHLNFTHMIVSAIVKGVIYDLIFKVMRNLSIPQALALVAIVLMAVAALNLIFNRDETRG